MARAPRHLVRQAHQGLRHLRPPQPVVQRRLKKLLLDRHQLCRPTLITLSVTSLVFSPLLSNQTQTSAGTGSGSTAISASGSGAPFLQTDVNNLITDLSSLLQQAESGTSSNAGTSNGTATTNSTSSTSTAATSTGTSDPTTTQPMTSTAAADPTSIQSTTSTAAADPAATPTALTLSSIEAMVTQDLINAIQAYGSPNTLLSAATAVTA